MKTERIIEAKREAERMFWSSSLTYLVGLIASDGSLRKKKCRISFASIDQIQTRNFKEIVENNVIRTTHPINVYKFPNSKRNNQYHYHFTSRKFYCFLMNVGIMPNKTFKLGSMFIPDKFFIDFLRGEIDGDGGFYYGEQRDIVRTQIASSSREFLLFLKNEINRLMNIKYGGSVRYRESGVFCLQFGMWDTKEIYEAVYKNTTKYFLPRKKKILDDYFKGFINKGRNGQAKLSIKQSIKIIQGYQERDITQEELADQYGVAKSTINLIVNFNHWTSKYLTG